MADLLALSSEILDRGSAQGLGPVNRINHELSELGAGLAMVEAFSHSIVFETEAGLVVFDASGPASGTRVVDAIRSWSSRPVHTLVYTHGHVDHVGGCGAFLSDGEARGDAAPRIVGHCNVARRFDRYRLTDGYNNLINDRQFRGASFRIHEGARSADAARSRATPRRARPFLPERSAAPDVTYRDQLAFELGGLQFELNHARGETDDHSWAWIPGRRAICAGDFFIWNFPNAGNPQKVQRFPLEWAAALRAMAERDAELFLPAHGLPICGRERIRRVLGEVAEVLENLVRDTVSLMNAGASLNDIVHSVKLPAELLARPYLRPLYDEPEFVVRNVWRLYGGWYDGNPAHLKPAPDALLARELAELAGGAHKLLHRAQALAERGDLRLACHLIEFAVGAQPDDRLIHAARAELYQQRRRAESSLMAKGIFGYAAAESQRRVETD